MSTLKEAIQTTRQRTLPSRAFSAYVAILILTVTFLAYVDTLALGFVFDDHVLIVTNDSIRSWRYLPTYFTSHIWSFRYPHLLANYYRPLFLIWLRLNDALFGLHAWGWHLTSVVVHVAVTWLVYRLAVRLLGAGVPALISGLVFGLHPVHVEAVADITSIQEPLSTFFILAVVLVYARSRDGSRASQSGRESRFDHIPGLIVALLLTAAALLSKESGMVLPLLVGALAWIYGKTVREPDGREFGSGGRDTFRHSAARSLRWSAPFWLMVFAYVPLRIHALKGFAHVVTPLPLTTLLLTIPSVLLFYFRLLIWPVGLSCYYDSPSASAISDPHFWLPLAGVLVIVGLIFAWWNYALRVDRTDSRAIAFGTVWAAVTIAPVLNFRFLPEGEIAHDRYLYLPSVGFALLVGAGLRALARWLKQRNSCEGGEAGDPASAHQDLTDKAVTKNSLLPNPFQQPAAWIFATLLAVALALATARQNLFWANDLTLNSRAHWIAPHNVYATTSLAAAIADRGMEGEARKLYAQALTRNPDFWRAHVNLAGLDYAMGNFAEAAQHYARACAIDPTDGDEFLYLGMSLLRMGRFQEAELAVRSALLVRPGGKNYHLGLAMVLRGERRCSEAEREISMELKSDPQNLQALNLGKEIAKDMKR